MTSSPPPKWVQDLYEKYALKSVTAIPTVEELEEHKTFLQTELDECWDEQTKLCELEQTEEVKLASCKLVRRTSIIREKLGQSELALQAARTYFGDMEEWTF